MNARLLTFFTLCCLLLSSCSLMQQSLKSESGLYSVPMTHSYKLPVDGFWTWGKRNPYAGQASGALYIAPMDVSAVQEDYPELAPKLVQQMHTLMSEHMGSMLAEANRANNTNWQLTDDAAHADIRIDLAVVNLRSQRPGLHLAAKVMGFFTPDGVSDAVDLISRGDVTIEGTIRDNRTELLMFAFKDSNRAKLHFYHKAAYRRMGHVDANLRLWARELAQLCRECACDRMGNHTLRERIEQRSPWDVIKGKLHNNQ